MNYALVGAYGIYFILVGVHGNASRLLTIVEDNGREFLVWILAVLVLRALYNVPALRPAVKPFIALAALTFVLINWNQVISQLDQILPANVQIPETKAP